MHLPPSETGRRSHRRRRGAPTADIVIVLVGLIAASSAGVIAYRTVGPYGDGPLNLALYRMPDPEFGKDLLYRRVRGADGMEARYVVEATTRRLHEVQVQVPVKGGTEFLGMRFEEGKLAMVERHDATGRTDVRDYFNDPSGLMKVGFSLTKNGIIDAWAYRDKNGSLVKVEVARGGDATVDRWEYYANGQLARVEEDDDRDGKVDRWLIYDAGILLGEVMDRDRDGKPDTPLPTP